MKKAIFVLLSCVMLCGCTVANSAGGRADQPPLNLDFSHLRTPFATPDNVKNTPALSPVNTSFLNPGPYPTQAANMPGEGTPYPSRDIINTPMPTKANSNTPTAPANTAAPTPVLTSAPTPGASIAPWPTSAPTTAPPPVYVKYPFIEHINTGYKYNSGLKTRPFWYGNVIYNESIVFIQQDGDISAKLLFKAKRIISVRDETLDIELKQGIHWDWDAAKPDVIRYLPGNSHYKCSYLTKGQLAGDELEEGCIKLGNALYCNPQFLAGRRLKVTYVYNEADSDALRGEYKGHLLPKTAEKLKAGALNFAVYGDDAVSNANDLEPSLKEDLSLKSLLTEGLRALLNSDYIYGVNYSQKGVLISTLLMDPKSVVVRKDTDLAIICFGINETRTNAADFAAKLKELMALISKQNPNCEFIILTSLKPNPDAKLRTAYPNALAAVQGLEGEGVAVIDIYSVFDKLQAVKSAPGLYADNVKLCNDFTARLISMYVLSALHDYTLVG